MSPRVPDLALDFINDALEYHSDIIVNGLEDGNMDEHWDALRYFWKISEDRQLSVGRIFHRCRLAELVYYACHMSMSPRCDLDGDMNQRSNFHQASEGNTTKQESSLDTRAWMGYWSWHDWEMLETKLLHLSHTCKREDANRIVTELADARPQDHKRAQDSRLFGKHLASLVDRITINKFLSHIRPGMEQWMNSKSVKQPNIDPRCLQQYWKGLQKIQGKNKIFQFLRQFLVPSSSDANVKLAPMHHLRDILMSTPCDLPLLQADLLSVALSWSKALFKNKDPELARLGYGNVGCHTTHAAADDTEGGHFTPKDEKKFGDSHQPHHNRSQKINIENQVDDRKPAAKSSPEAVQDMRHAMAHLKHSAQDPLSEAWETARRATLQPRQIKPGVVAPEKGSSRGKGSTAAAAGRSPRQTKRTGRSKKTGVDYNGDSEHASPSRKKKQARDCNNSDDVESEITDPSLSPREGVAQAAKYGGVFDGGCSEQATGKRRRSKDKHGQKKARKLVFNDSDDDTTMKSVTLSELPGIRPRTPQQRDQRGTKRSRGTGRRAFTMDEKNAIKEGIRRFGQGRWVEIRKEFPDVLKDRTNVQIKDCYRTMKKQGEIDSDSESE